MDDNGLDLIKNEIVFFMEKSFQFSFVYVGAVFAVLATTKFELVDRLAQQLAVKPASVILVSLLVLNLIYITLASSCIFAILKRGHFILSQGGHTKLQALVKWEKFLRKSPDKFGRLRWNIDNYFMWSTYGLVLMLTFGAVTYAAVRTCWQTKVVAFSLGALQVVAVLILAASLKRLNAMSKDFLKKQDGEESRT